MKENNERWLSQEDMHAYVDGKLPPDRAGQIAQRLASDPAMAAEVADYQQINAMLRGAYDDVLNEPVPLKHVAAIQLRRVRFAVPMAAAFTGLMVGAWLGWASHGLNAGGSALNQLAERSSAAYVVYAPEKRHPVEVTGADTSGLSAWLSNRMGMTVTIPKLDGLGFELVGGRLMIGQTAPAALVMYQNGQERRIVLYVRNDLPSEGKSRMRYSRTGETSAIAWTDGQVGYGLAGGFSEKELMPVANLVRAQFTN